MTSSTTNSRHCIFQAAEPCFDQESYVGCYEQNVPFSVEYPAMTRTKSNARLGLACCSSLPPAKLQSIISCSLAHLPICPFTKSFCAGPHVNDGLCKDGSNTTRIIAIYCPPCGFASPAPFISGRCRRNPRWREVPSKTDIAIDTGALSPLLKPCESSSSSLRKDNSPLGGSECRRQLACRTCPQMARGCREGRSVIILSTLLLTPPKSIQMLSHSSFMRKMPVLYFGLEMMEQPSRRMSCRRSKNL